MAGNATALDYNVEVVLELGREAGKAMPSAGAAWAHGLVVGLALGAKFPQTAQTLRNEIERRAGALCDVPAEQAEVIFTSIVDMFDRSADQ